MLQPMIPAAELCFWNGPLLDVRSPSEFEQGHVPGAISFPLFNDEERAEIGTLYKHVGAEHAWLRGLEITGPRMATMVRQAKKIAPSRQITIHCWRGGQRSGSVAWLLRQAGFEVQVVQGGYKAYRQWVLQQLSEYPWKLLVLAGNTGSQKTQLLQELQQLGEAVIDLEALAHHKGSAFGHLGEAAQPSTEQFENNLLAALWPIKDSQPIWIESESKAIGRVYLTAGFFERLLSSPLIELEMPFEERLKNSVAVYGQYPTAKLAEQFIRIQKRLGGLAVKDALEALEQGNLEKAAAIALKYYDKGYQNSLERHHPGVHHYSVMCEGIPLEARALKVMEVARKINLFN